MYFRPVRHGATVIDDIEAMPASLVLWRALTHWFGGLGIIVIFIAVFPQFGKGIVHMFNAESTGPRSDRALPRIKEMAKALFTVYVVFTVASTVVFMLCGMSFLIAADHAFATIATGGFSPYNNSVAHFDSPVVECCLSFFMLISSANFGMYVAAWKKGCKVILGDTEFRVYLAIVAISTAAMASTWSWPSSGTASKPCARPFSSPCPFRRRRASSPTTLNSGRSFPNSSSWS